MSNLLSANMARLKKNRVFLIFVVFMIVYAFAVCIYVRIQKSMGSMGSMVSFDTLFLNGYGLGGFIAFPGIILAIVCGIFIGTDFNDGALRNKIIVGKSRDQIYFSNFITCVAIGLALNLVYWVVICAVGIPWIGWIEMPLKTFVILVFDGTLMIVAYAAVFNMLAMLSKDKTIAVVIGLVGVIVFMFLSIYLMLRIMDPEYVNAVVMKDGGMTEEVVRNSRYLSDSARKICQFIIDFLPTGQSIQLSNLTAPNILRMPVYSVVVIIVSNLTGFLTFRKTNLK